MAVTKAEQVQQLKRNEEKWSSILMEAGWTVVPSIILEKQHALGLDPIDINILMQLANLWWYSDNLPYPSKALLAKLINVDPSTVRRHIARMEKDGFIWQLGPRILRPHPGLRRSRDKKSTIGRHDIVDRGNPARDTNEKVDQQNAQRDLSHKGPFVGAFSPETRYRPQSLQHRVGLLHIGAMPALGTVARCGFPAGSQFEP